MRPPHPRRALGTLLALTLFAAACGGDDASTTDEPAIDEPAADDEPADEPAAGDEPAAEPAADEPAADDDPATIAEPQEFELGAVGITVPAGSPEVTAAIVDEPAIDGWETVAAIEFGPAGTTFASPVVVTAPQADHGPGSLTAYSAWLTDADGSAEALPVAVGDDDLTVEVEHFSRLQLLLADWEQAEPSAPVSVGETFQFVFDAGDGATPVWNDADPPAGVDVFSSETATFVCLEPGEFEVYLWGEMTLPPTPFTPDRPTEVDVHAHGWVECVDTGVTDLATLATILEFLENHPGGSVPDVDFVEGLSAIMALLDSGAAGSPLHLGLLLDLTCDGPTADDRYPFGPAPIPPGGEAAPLIIDQYGCYLPVVSDPGAIDVPPGSMAGLTVDGIDTEMRSLTLSNGAMVYPLPSPQGGGYIQLQVVGNDGPMVPMSMPGALPPG